MLEAIGLRPEVIDGAIRVGLSRLSTEDDIDAVKGLRLCFLDLDLLALERQGLAGALRAGKRHQLAYREVALFEALPHLGSDDARGAENGYTLSCHGSCSYSTISSANAR